MRRLNAQDDRWLAIDTPENPYQIGALLLFETDSARPPGDFATAVALPGFDADAVLDAVAASPIGPPRLRASL